jgi:hypothetical protein
MATGGDPKESLNIYREINDLVTEINANIERTNSFQNAGNEEIEKQEKLVDRLNDLKRIELELLDEEYDLRKKTRKLTFDGLKENIKAGESYRKMQKDNDNLYRSIRDLQKQAEKASDKEKETLKEIIKLKQRQYVENQAAADSVGRSVIGGKAMASLIGRMVPVAGVLGGIFSEIKDFFINYYDKLDKAARTLSVDVGMTSEQMMNLRRQAALTAVHTQAMGVHIADMLAGQKSYNDALGRSVVLSSKMMADMTDIALGTDLGADGAGRMAASFEAFGYNMTDVKDLVETTFITNQKLGLNSSKVLKNIEGSLKTAQKYSFKDGAKNLAQMAQTATSVKMSMESVFGLSEKLFELEGAVELSAQLQVLGGSFAALGDPMQLIYQARNDMEGLQKSLIEATKGVAMFDKATGEFKIPSAELHRLRKVAEATGISIDEMTESALALARQEKALSQVKNLFEFDKEQQESIKNLAQLNKGTGKFEILVGDNMELLENLSSDNLKKAIGEQNRLAQAATQRLTFFDKMKNLFEILKAGFAPIMDKVIAVLDRSNFAENLTKAMETVGNIIGNMIEGGGLDSFLTSITEGIKSVGEWIGRLFDPNKNTTMMDALTSLGKMLGGVLMVAWNNSFGRLGSLLRFENKRGEDIMSFNDLEQVNDGDISPSGLVISKPTPMGLKPIAQGAPNDTAYLRKNGMGGDVNVNLNGTLKLDLGMGVSLDMRRDLINNPEFKYSILQLVSNKMLELTNGTA